jgi:hypothetical protein
VHFLPAHKSQTYFTGLDTAAGLKNATEILSHSLEDKTSSTKSGEGGAGEGGRGGGGGVAGDGRYIRHTCALAFSSLERKNTPTSSP